jgi:hypothetical protein
MATDGKVLRCAIYTRKSTEHGLEQEFNSLDAQREACEAYIKSQAFQGWRALPQHYNDPAYWGRYPIEHQAWMDLAGRLAGRASLVPLSMSLQRAGHLDVTLRAIEDEFVSHSDSTSPFGFHFQLMFSEAWLILSYEALRAFRQREDEAAKAAQAADPNQVRDDVSSLASFQSLFRDLELLRVPIAKYEIAKEGVSTASRHRSKCAGSLRAATPMTTSTTVPTLHGHISCLQAFRRASR